MQSNNKTLLKTKIINNTILFSLIGILLYFMGQWVIPFVIALILAYAFHIPAQKLSEKLHISSAISAGIVVLVFLAFVSVFTIFLLPIFKNALITLAANLPNLLLNFPKFINEFFRSIFQKFDINIAFDIGTILRNAIIELTSDLPNYITDFVNTGLTLVYIIMFLFMTPIITFYLLKDWEKIDRFFYKFLNKIFSQSGINIIREINTKLGLYAKGQLIVCVILSCLYILGLFLVGVNKYFVCGVLSGILSVAPFFGPFIGLLTTLAISINNFSYFYQYLITICIYLIVPFFDSNFITPKYIGRKTGIQPVWLLFSICCSVSILGTMGIFISVPIAVVFSTACKELIKKL